MTELSREDMMAAVTEGVRKAFADFLSVDIIADAITDGVKQALDQLWPSQIAGAITEGVREAMRHR